MNSAYRLRIAQLNESLGIPAEYERTRSLPLQNESELNDLVAIHPTLEDKAVLLVSPAADAWTEMVTAAGTQGVDFYALSGFRSVDRQAELIRMRLAKGRSLADILSSTAAPGYSEHHTGRAIDIGCPGSEPLEEVFETTRAFHWLSAHAGEFGFKLSYPRNNPYGIVFEPWHWLWVKPDSGRL